MVHCITTMTTITLLEILSTFDLRRALHQHSVCDVLSADYIITSEYHHAQHLAPLVYRILLDTWHRVYQAWRKVSYGLP